MLSVVCLCRVAFGNGMCKKSAQPHYANGDSAKHMTRVKVPDECRQHQHANGLA